MQLANLDMICRRWLLDRGYPIHWYLEALFHSSTAIREMSKDTLNIVNTVNLPVDDYGAFELPGDFVDDVAVCFSSGGQLQQIPHKNRINPLRIHDATTGQFVSQPTINQLGVDTDVFWGAFGFGWGWFWNINEYGEPTGRAFGANGGSGRGYTVVRERRQVQLSDGFAGGNVIFQYISNGQSADNATQIDWRAFRAITTFIDWQRSPNATMKDSPEARTFYNERRLLRAELSELSMADIKDVLRSSYTASLKN